MKTLVDKCMKNALKKRQQGKEGRKNDRVARK
jgi:hypothetical protein